MNSMAEIIGAGSGRILAGTRATDDAQRGIRAELVNLQRILLEREQAIMCLILRHCGDQKACLIPSEEMTAASDDYDLSQEAIASENAMRFSLVHRRLK